MKSILKRVKAIIIVICLFQGLAEAQATFKVLKVGDKFPDYTFVNLINYPSRTVNFAEFKGKLLILDFWSTGCRSCIEAFPKLLDLQSKFGSRIQILLVNSSQDESAVRQVFESRRKRANVNVTLPTVCKDSTLGNVLFKNRTLPTVAWIDRTGVLRSITYGDALNETNIASFLNDVTPYMPQKEFSEKASYNFADPLFINNNGGNGEELVWYSILSKQIPGLPSTYYLTADDQNGYRIGMSNLSILELYRVAYSNRTSIDGAFARLQYNRIVFDVEDSSKYFAKTNGMNDPKLYYTYQLISPPATKERLQEVMQLDLQKFFGLKASWERKTIKCLVLSASDTSKLIYKNGKRALMLHDNIVKLNNVQIGSVVKFIEDFTAYQTLPYPIIDETNFKGNVGGIDLNVNFLDHKAFDKALQKYDMSLKLEDREVDLLIVRKQQ
jgi:thiol-disulfide isomerase/thioredoxin